MLDKQDGQLKFLLDPVDEFHKLGNLPGIHAGGRFIQEEQLRSRGEGPGDFQPSLQAIGEVLRRCCGVLFQLEAVQERKGMVLNLFFLPLKTAQAEQGRNRLYLTFP